MTAPLVVPALLGRGDPAALRRMKRTATGLLAGAALVFLGTFALPDGAATGFLRAAAEAGMIGGLADWFAVTALFRHPLGIPVPHTALIPRKKDELATKLGEFVTGNFLTPDAVALQLAEARLVRRVAERLAEPANAALVGAEVAAGVAAVLDALDAGAVAESVLDLAQRDLRRRSYTPVLGQFLTRAVEGRGQRPLVDVAVTRGRAYLATHRDELLPQLRDYVGRQRLVVRWIASERRLDDLLSTAIDVLGEVEADPEHELRTWLDGLLASVATDLRDNPATAAKVDTQLQALLEDPHLQALLHVVVQDVVGSVRASLQDVDGGLQDRLAGIVGQAAQRVLGDADLERRIQDRLQAGVRYAVVHYGDTVIALIQRTVGEWEGRDAASRIEASVGRDLQFIRINGTVVGALAGVAIHAVSVLLG